jgi:hypothetical protein
VIAVVRRWWHPALRAFLGLAGIAFGIDAVRVVLGASISRETMIVACVCAAVLCLEGATAPRDA